MPVAKKLVHAAAIVALGAGMTTTSVATSARPASAAARCSGSLVEAQPIKKKSDGTVLGWLNLYWDGSDNCAEVQSAGSTWGVKKYMSLLIESCPLSDKGSSTCHTIASKRDYGNYAYYAGPVKVSGVGRCVAASGEIDLNNYVYQNWTHPYVGHC